MFSANGRCVVESVSAAKKARARLNVISLKLLNIIGEFQSVSFLLYTVVAICTDYLMEAFYEGWPVKNLRYMNIS